jgi:hypothetical protein
MPKLPNDTPYVPREHWTTKGKRYVRTTMRVRTRRTKGTTGELPFRSAM